MAHNGEAGGSGGGAPKTCLRKAEAAFFYRHRIPVPPGMRLPSGGGWSMSALGYVVPPLPEGERLQRQIEMRRKQLTPEQRADPAFDQNSSYWSAVLAAERQRLLDDHDGVDRPLYHNSEERRRWWLDRDFAQVMREFGYVGPEDLSPDMWDMQATSPPRHSSSSSARSSSTRRFVKIKPE